jgi:hypothetical protein
LIQVNVNHNRLCKMTQMRCELLSIGVFGTAMLNPFQNAILRIKTILRKNVIRDVPNELAACEFDCRVGECSHGKWEQCERRILFARLQEHYDKLRLRTDKSDA